MTYHRAMRWMLVVGVVCLVIGACGSGAEMRPRGRRNSLRIDALDDRISAIEGRKDTLLSGGPPKPHEQRVRELEAELAKATAQVKQLTDRLQALEVLGAQPASAAAPAPPP